jgi:hypothetical protein
MNSKVTEWNADRYIHLVSAKEWEDVILK